MPDRIEVSGNPASDLHALAGHLADLSDLDAQAAQIVARKAAELAPKRSGRLGRSIGVARAGGAVTITAGGPAVPYVWPVVSGVPARGIRPNTFITRAEEQTTAQFVAVYETGIDQMVDGIGE